MLIDSREFKDPQQLTADVCIIGGGISGIVLANELVGTGKSVIVIEAGGEEFDEESQKLYRVKSFPENFPDPANMRLRMLGGSSNHWENSTERFDPIDFVKRDWVADSGWPIDYVDVAKHYSRAGDYCGVETDGYDVEPWLGKKDFKNICEGSNQFKPALVKSALPPTRFYQKYSERLNRSDNITIVSYATMTDLDFDLESEQVRSIEFESTTRIKSHVSATLFIFSMGGIENPRLLLQINEKYNNALGNRFDHVGRYFMEHPVIRGAHFYPIGAKKIPTGYSGIFDRVRLLKLRLKMVESAVLKHRTNNLRIFFVPQPKTILSHGISSTHIVFDNLSQAEWPDQFGMHLSNILGEIDLVADAFSRKTLDTALVSDATEFGGYQVLAMIEQTPDRENRIYLDEERDRFGIKKVNIDYRVTDIDKKLALKTLQELSIDAGLSQWGRLRLLPERSSRIWGEQLGFSAHHMGTTKMATNEKQGVVDSNCQVFGAKNLYMSGSSVFPTGGHVPPTLTITAMSVRLAETIKQRLGV
jgi:choline dehydrogenase-like flavoprotein